MKRVAHYSVLRHILKKMCQRLVSFLLVKSMHVHHFGSEFYSLFRYERKITWHISHIAV